MVGIGVLCALLIVLTFEGTKPRIERLRAEALEQAIFRTIRGAESMQAFVWNGQSFERLPEGSGREASLYAGYTVNGELVGMAIEGSGQGYADVIRILYGYNWKAQQVVGFEVLETKETPGLGDKIEKDPAFLVNFEALDVSLDANNEALKNSIETVKSGTKTQPWQVDGITGATISSRTIGSILNESGQTWFPRIQRHIQTFQTR